MKQFFLLLLLATSCFAAGTVADIYVKIENESASVYSVLVSYGDRVFVPPGSTYEVRTYLDESSYSAKFDIPKGLVFTDSPSGGSASVFEQNPVELFLPFYGSTQMLEIWRGENLLLSISLEPYLCNNNGVCDNEEYSLVCKDCPSGGADYFCDRISDGKCDPDCIYGYDSDCKPGEGQHFITVDMIENETREGNTSYPESTPEKYETPREGRFLLRSSDQICFLAIIAAITAIAVFVRGKHWRKKEKKPDEISLKGLAIASLLEIVLWIALFVALIIFFFAFLLPDIDMFNILLPIILLAAAFAVYVCFGIFVTFAYYKAKGAITKNEGVFASVLPFAVGCTFAFFVSFFLNAALTPQYSIVYGQHPELVEPWFLIYGTAAFILGLMIRAAIGYFVAGFLEKKPRKAGK